MIIQAHDIAPFYANFPCNSTPKNIFDHTRYGTSTKSSKNGVSKEEIDRMYKMIYAALKIAQTNSFCT